MAAEPVRRPPGIVVEPNNWFHQGWLAAVLGLKPNPFTDPDHPIADTNCDAYMEGYRMGIETRFNLTPLLARMQSFGQISVEERPRHPDEPGRH